MTVLIVAFKDPQELEKARAFALRRWPNESIVEKNARSEIDTTVRAIVTPAVMRRNSVEDIAVDGMPPPPL